MAGSIAFDHILNYAVLNAKKSNPSTMEYQAYAGNNEWKTNSVDTDEFFRDMSGTLLENGLLNERASMFDAKIQTARSIAFAMHAVNNIDTAGRIKKNIDNFFKDEKNGSWFEEQGIESNAEKEKLHSELKKHVDEKLAVKTQSNEALKVVHRLRKAYQDYSGLGDENAFYRDSMSFFHSVNHGLIAEAQPDKAVMDAYQHRNIREGITTPADWLYEVLQRNSWVKILAEEVEPTYENVQNLRVFYGEGIDVKPSEFLNHMNKKGKSSLKEKLWANDLYQNILEKVSNFQEDTPNGRHKIPITDIMLNGKPMFSEDDLSKKDCGELACTFVQNVLNGENVSVDVSGKGNFVHIEPNFYEVMEKPNKGFFERLYDIIVNLFGTKEKDKIAEIQQNISEKAGENKSCREKMTIDNLMGSNTIEKVTRPPADQKEMSAGKSPKGKDASSGL